MNGKRLGAVVLAIALVAVAFVVRGAGGDETLSGATSTNDSGAPTTTAPAVADRAVVCIPELEAVCAAIADAEPGRDVQVEPVWTTFEFFVAAPAIDDLPLWITVAPFPAMVDAQRSFAGEDPLGLTVAQVAASPLAVAFRDEPRSSALAAECAEQDVWACIGDLAGAPWTEAGGEASWGTVRPSFGDVTTSATALVSFSAAAAGYFGSTTFSRSDWEADPGFSSWVRRLARTVPAADLSSPTPLAQIATGRANVDIAATTDAELAALGAGADRFAVQYPASATTLDAVIAAPDGGDTVDELVTTAQSALIDAEWAAPPSTPAAAPSASTTLALVQLWKDAA